MSRKDLTNFFNNRNERLIRQQICMKQSSEPFYGTTDFVQSTITDMDHFPYTRFYRGVYHSSKPIVVEREAGWRPRQDSCYQVNRCTEVSNKIPKGFCMAPFH